MTSAAEKKDKAEILGYSFISVLVIVGFGLCLSALLLPYWYKSSFKMGIVEFDADIGLYQDELCPPGGDCETHWITDDDYDRPDGTEMPKFHAIRGLETGGVINAFFALFGLLSIWCNRKSKSQCRKTFAQGQFFGSSLVAGSLCVTGTLLLSSEVSRGDIGYAAVLAGIGSGCLLISASLSCLVCRYDPTYGTLENPVASSFRKP